MHTQVHDKHVKDHVQKLLYLLSQMQRKVLTFFKRENEDKMYNKTKTK